jgi:hypothetical protein
LIQIGLQDRLTIAFLTPPPSEVIGMQGISAPGVGFAAVPQKVAFTFSFHLVSQTNKVFGIGV